MQKAADATSGGPLLRFFLPTRMTGHALQPLQGTTVGHRTPKPQAWLHALQEQ